MLPSQLRFGPFVMDRRRAVALILGLVLCLALLGRWLVRPENDGLPAASTESGTPTGSIAAIVQAPRDEPEDGGVVSYQAPIGPGVFRGRVIDAATRQPLREFTVEFYPPRQAGQPEPSSIARSFQTTDGRFGHSGLPTVTGTLYITASGYQRFDMDNVRISDDASVEEISIPMRAGHVVRGRVVDEVTKAPIASAMINFRDTSQGRYEGNFRDRPTVRSKKDGTFVLDGVPPGTVRVAVGAPNYAGKEVEIVASAKSPPVEIALSKGGTIAGYLAGADGITPVAGNISLANLDENSAIAMPTGSAGEFSFARLRAARYQLIGNGGGLHGLRELELSHNEQLEGIVLPMSPGHSVRGVVFGLRPEERAEAYIYIMGQGSRTGFTLNARLDERGAYEVRGVAPGSILVQATSPRGIVTKEARMPADTDLTVDLQFKSGARLSGRVTTGGKPLANVMLRPSSRGQANPEKLHLKPRVTSTNGEYAIEDVPDGDYVIMIESFASPRVRVTGDTVFDIDIPEVQLSGRVLEEGGKVPVVGAMINLRPAQPRAIGSRLGDSSNNFGQFGIRGLQPGDFVVTAYKAGYELYRAPLAYGSPISDMTIHLRPAPGVEIKVREASSDKRIDNVIVVENVGGVTGLVLELQTDENGVSYLPAGLAGGALTVSAFGYGAFEVVDWNGQQLDVRLPREQ